LFLFQQPEQQQKKLHILSSATSCVLISLLKLHGIL
jgi:hypothetical protein